jgi:hypothetical protein
MLEKRLQMMALHARQQGEGGVAGDVDSFLMVSYLGDQSVGKIGGKKRTVARHDHDPAGLHLE